ncbi:MAG: hypothetical protein IPK64_15280 [bacterium]|nr:hypothetical protein [bacterium]
MDATIPVDRLHRVMAARGWRLVSATLGLATYADAGGRTALIRLVQGDPDRAVLADMLPFARGVRLAAAAAGGSDLVMATLADDDDGGSLLLAALPPERDAPADDPQPARQPSRPVLRLTIEPGDATTEQVGRFLSAISDLNRALGGAGLEFQRLEGPPSDGEVRRG